LERYENLPDRPDLVICRDCSSRSFGYLLARKEIPAHDYQHALDGE
jgi:hypothetical protein